ncbi:hypothetical protein KAF25_004993 [Fusarium avenaceum]|uniref:Uncharacterized protein n=1 Tax=Fusarium avenaceum TaxID=40199 RepID=A0A9P7HBL3_9HYPO|nr:hypothetical protein KAF25_004993 [Fusarium avenaceum]
MATEEVIKTHLKRKDTPNSVTAFLSTLETFPSDFITTSGITGIYYNIIWLFARWNLKRIGKRIRSRRAYQPRRVVYNSESPTPSLDGSLASLHASPADDGGDSLLSSQSTSATQNTVPDAPRNERRQMNFGQRFSPDELAEDHYSQPDAQQQHLYQVQQERESLNRIDLDRQPSLPPIHLAPVAIPPVITASIGTQTFDQDEPRPREQNAPPPSSMNTNSASQESNRAHNNRDNRAHPSSSIEEIERPHALPLARPRNARPVVGCTIDIVVSYDFMPGNNVELPLVGNIFSYSLKQLFDKAKWQTNFQWLFILLQAPSKSPGVRNPCFMERVLINDERKFQTVLRRFKLQAESLKSCYTQLNKDAVIEICFEPLINGHSHSVHFDAWYRHMN